MQTLPLSQEIEIVEKLVENRHLNSIERDQLPYTGARASLIRSYIERKVSKDKQFPALLKLEELFDGCLLRAEENDMWKVYWKVEASVAQSAMKEVRTFTSCSAAADYFMRTEFRDGIDGIRVDWSS